MATHREHLSPPPILSSGTLDQATALNQILYSAHAFLAVVFPVSLSMIIAAILVVFVNDGYNGKTAGGVGIPVVFEETAGSAGEERFVGALVNALVIVGVIVGATFLLVFLYYFNFMKLLMGWLITSVALLLAFSVGLVAQTAFALWNAPVDAVSYAFVFYNFAVVGVIAVFYQKGLPALLTGGYLIVISVTMAWILIRFLPEWTAWALLAVLAFYDMCAVLTPCGPLKWLVGIMQTRDQPLPGLLYEARVGRTNEPVPADQQPPPTRQVMQSSLALLSVNESTGRVHDEAGPSLIHVREQEIVVRTATASPRSQTVPSLDITDDLADVESHSNQPSNEQHSNYRPPKPPKPSTTMTQFIPGTASSNRQPLPSPQNHQSRYVQREDVHEDEEEFYEDEEEDRSIKLGLGDFVFYSLLCAKAALASFTTFIAVFIVVLFGLALTLLLLALYRTALPALPISILLGLVFYFLVDLAVVPYVFAFTDNLVFT